MPRKAKVEEYATETVVSIKGFNRDLTCRDFQFAIGETYEIGGKIEPCRNGFHACPETVDPLKVFSFYAPGQSRYCLVEQSGTIVPHDDDKAASSTIKLVREIGVGEIVDRAVAFRIAAIKAGEGAASNSGDSGAASNSGDYGAASNSGSRGAASNSGSRGAASNSGDSGAASNSGDYGAAFSTGYGGKVMSEKDGCSLHCDERGANYNIVSAACGITGRDGIKAGVWYVCKGGKLVEAA